MDQLMIIVFSVGVFCGSLAREYFTKKDYKEGLIVGIISAIILYISASFITYLIRL